MPWPQNSRTTLNPCASAWLWMAWPMSPEIGARAHRADAEPHALVGDLAQAPRLDRRLADVEHAAGVAVEAVLDDGDVDVDDVAGLQSLVARHAVAHDVVDRGADRLGIGRIAGRRVVERGRHRALHVDHVVMAQRVQLVGGDAGLDVRRDEVEHLAGEAASHAHLFDFFRRLDGNRHVNPCAINAAG